MQSLTTFSWGLCYQIMCYLIKIHSWSCNLKRKDTSDARMISKYGCCKCFCTWGDCGGRIHEVKGTCAINLFVNSMRWWRKLIGHRAITCDMLSCPTNICAMYLSLGRAMPSSHMMHDSSGETMACYAEHVRCTLSSELIPSHCVNMGDSVFDSFWRDAE